MSLLSLSFLCYLLSVLHIFSFILINSAYPLNNETDQIALLDFKSKINDPLGVLTSWNTSRHFCQWYGVTCGRRHERVTMLNLTVLKLSGFISPYVGNLSFLRELHLNNNSLSSQIPPQISRLSRLKVLSLHDNLIGGEIPSNISACSNLDTILLYRNKLMGEVPPELSSMKKLKTISLAMNNLTGTIPPSFGNLSSLDLFHITRNNLGGILPESLGQLMNLRILALGGNRFSGMISYSIFNLSLIDTIDLGFNYLEGTLPMNLGISVQNLRYFSIGSNRFTGHIPTSISNASNLVVLQLNMNNFTGGVPSIQKLNKLLALRIYNNHLGTGKDKDMEFLSDLTNATSLELLQTSRNNFGGKLPHTIGNLSKTLERVTFTGNQIYGKIPESIESLVNLKLFDASFNKLTGTIPSSIGKLKYLGKLEIFNNRFVGNIPSSLGNLTNLIKLDLSHNKLQGLIPSSLGNCKNLIVLDLSDNNLTGPISTHIFKTYLLVSLSLSKNNLHGSLPNEVGNLKQLGNLYLQHNMLSQEIPRGLAACESLEELDMSDNFFKGPIPTFLRALGALRILDLSSNNLSGKIPNFLIGFRFMEKLDISYNNLEGSVPTEGIFKNPGVVSLKGNKNLCGGISIFGLHACTSDDSIGRLTVKVKRIIMIVSAFLGSGIVVACLFLWLSRKSKKTPTMDTSENGLLRLSYHSLLKATNEFSLDNLIGSGSFGSVYKGILEPDGLVIAVKVLNLMRRGASKSFLAECEVLKNVRHRNLLKVLTACSGVDYRGNDFKALVYEFMDNGSLHDWLHPNAESDEAPRRLNMLQKLNVAIDIAYALEYLHNYSGTPIVHCDLKPSNVLLDKEMTAHVSDFGLVKFLLNGALNSATSQSSSIGGIGTIGYCPPEYGLGGDASIAGDVFSFGVLLLEMFTGKSPIHDMFREGLNLHRFVERALPKKVMEITDPYLLEIEYTDQNTTSSHNHYSANKRKYKFNECLISIFEIGISCSSESPQNRMNIRDVIAQLSSVRDKLFGTQLCLDKKASSTLQLTTGKMASDEARSAR